MRNPNSSGHAEDRKESHGESSYLQLPEILVIRDRALLNPSSCRDINHGNDNGTRENRNHFNDRAKRYIPTAEPMNNPPKVPNGAGRSFVSNQYPTPNPSKAVRANFMPRYRPPISCFFLGDS